MRTALLIFCLVSTMAFGANPHPGSSGLDPAFQRLYAFDFAGSRDLAEQYMERNSADPMGPAVVAAAALYSELDRLNGLGGNAVSEGRIKDGQSLKPDPKVRDSFWSSVGRSQQLAQQAIQRNGGDRRALLSLVITSGLQRDYTALIDKRLRQSMEYIKQAHSYSTEMLKLDPLAHDAYLNTGFSEYLIGSFPAVLRLVVKIDGVEGNKDKGFAQMEKAAQSGHYLRPFAQLMLASFYEKENRKSESERWLRAMAKENPDNAVIQRAVARLDRKLTGLSR